MSKLFNGIWTHRIYCNFYHEGPCKCCDRHPEWPYPDELLDKYKDKSLEEAMDLDVKEKWPDAIPRS